ncbi:PepSY-associated TM helix domain-containing protein [Phenylobacterium sp. LjRoot225]|uniref:PepSY-associated TM helix domain-containing protein n=1 Tax=Phenylobacterium sp. LjRoot225 TaxID=3342285 RepID=UPI003ECFAC98
MEDGETAAPNGFRASMNWLHTWAGVVIGGVLFAIFWMGSLSVFDREIDRWTMPMTRIDQSELRSLDALKPIVERLVDKPEQWSIVLPSERVPTVQVRARERGGEEVRRHVDPASGALLDPPGTLGGTRFFYPFHYRLHIRLFNLGEWLVGVAAMTMLVMCVSGVVIHKKIFADFFTLRIVKKPQRTTLDLHNLTGVFGLPFNFIIALSGLIIFFSVYMPTPQMIAYGGGKATLADEAYGRFKRKAADRPAPLASLDAMQAEAMRRWNGERPEQLRVYHPGDAKSYVELRRSSEHGVTDRIDAIYFDGPTGAVIKAASARPIASVQRFVAGLHLIQFRHWTLRWLYFICGLSGCVLIGTGFLFWVQSRRKRHEKLGLRGVGVVEGLSVGATTGILIATLGFLIANRLLPLTIPGREALEVWTFYLVWVASFAHAWIRPRGAWAEQCWTIAAAAPLAVILNAATTGDTLIRTALRGQWSVAGMDLTLLAGGAIASVAALRLQRRAASAPTRALYSTGKDHV